jgi:isocitrate dehydrogenase
MTSGKTPTISWTIVDEAPALATYALLPVVEAYIKGCDVSIETRDISLAGASSPPSPRGWLRSSVSTTTSRSSESWQRRPKPTSSSCPTSAPAFRSYRRQSPSCRARATRSPTSPEEPSSPEEHELRARFARVLGSAVNPVLREGNSDRRPAAAVKAFARKHPHRMMKEWAEVGVPGAGGAHERRRLYSSEQSLTLQAATEAGSNSSRVAAGPHRCSRMAFTCKPAKWSIAR